MVNWRRATRIIDEVRGVNRAVYDGDEQTAGGRIERE